ncbi:LOW QUALITY PROTEIN: serine/threonine-protein phosphatase 2A activator-like [Rhopalosiphum padi]|uniref:LOW QUALITY PROTEIN: serine/threonine-protein phosphatase 2A activator-like n=1 Tax=Rhopalosiphum padi TaxID=40932 RepID=UPI00298DA09D|nr:LOW QUALITY PROTEIN: serine/threonine-protein phosphatase 2A activator-like [Rhopalosiphum padi]
MQTYADFDADDTDRFPVPVIGASLPVEIVGRRVHQPRDMFDWERSEARADVLVFVHHMNDVVKRYPSAAAARRRWRRRQQRGRDCNVDKVMAVLRVVGEWAEKRCSEPAGHDHLPMMSAAEHFGHFHGQLRAEGRALLDRTYDSGCGRADYRSVMLPAYLERSFGDPVTMTYGPAHELSFCVFLVALFKLHRLTWADEPFIVTVIFDRYLDVVDYVIRSYRLCPSAGSERGNWCLSGYQFVGFLWGSAQLAGTYGDDGSGSDGRLPTMSSPAAAVPDADACRRHRDEYVFAKCMDAAHRRAKTGVPLWFHSYQLWNLTALPRWDRVNGCLMAAYQCDVLDRFEVVRQLAFCELFKFAQNVRPPGTSFYDIIPAAPASETAVVRTTANVSADYDDDATDDEGRTAECGEWEDGETEDFEIVANEGLIIY